MKCKSMLAALALMLTNGAANVYAADANNLPQYDSVAFCNTTSSIIVISEDFKEQAIESCMEKEKQAPDQIRRAEAFGIATARLEANKTRVIELAERLVINGRVDASEFLQFMNG
jgi:hypothetical protein